MKKLIGVLIGIVLFSCAYCSFADYTDVSGLKIDQTSDGTSDGALVYEGVTDDAYEVYVRVLTDPTADVTISIPTLNSGVLLVSTLTTNDVNVANSVWGVSNGVNFEGATADAFEATVAPLSDPTADVTVSFPSLATGVLVISNLATNDIDVANSVWAESNALVFEGSSADAAEIRLSPTNVTGDRTVTIPEMLASNALMASLLTTNAAENANSVWGISNGINFEGATADTSELTLAPADVTADRTVTIPNQTGTVMLAGAATAITAGATPTITVLPGYQLLTDTIITDNQDQTIGVSGTGSAGDMMTIIFVTDTGGSNDEIITFGTNIRSIGTLTLANATANRYTVTFISDGTKWNEVARTAIQAA